MKMSEFSSARHLPDIKPKEKKERMGRGLGGGADFSYQRKVSERQAHKLIDKFNVEQDLPP